MNSIIGFHYSSGGNKNGIGDFMERLNANGIPFLMKGVDDAGLCFEGQQKGAAHGVQNHLIYRVSTAGQSNGVQYDVPDYAQSPSSAAQEHFDKTAPKWPVELKKDVVWMEPINEPRAKLSDGDIQWNNMHPVDWLGFFMYEYAKIANAQGFKVCGPSFNAGEPEVFSTNDYEQPGMLAYFQYCAANPTKAALSIHEYTWDRWQWGESWPDWYPQLWGRVEAAIAACDKHNISRSFSIFVTEWGFAYDNAPRWPECKPYLTSYNQWAARWPQVKGAAAWTLSGGWGDVSSDLQSWFDPLSDYAVDTVFDPGPQPARTNTAFGGTLPGGGQMEIKSFEDGWVDDPTQPDRRQIPNGFTLSVIPKGQPLRYGNDGNVTGTIEAKHLRCPQHLPPNECLGQPKALILHGDWTYKMQAVVMKSGTSLKTTFAGSGRKRITVPIQVHWQGDVPNDPHDVYVGVYLNGELIKLLQHPELKDRQWHYVTGEADGPVEVEVHYQTSWDNSRDCWTDYWTSEEIETMPDCNGLPRVQYTRRYNVIPQGATEAQAAAIFLEGWRRSKETTGGSYDDAGIGDLTNKIANLYGIAEAQKQVFIDWYAQYYPGTTVNFLSLPEDNPDNPF